MSILGDSGYPLESWLVTPIRAAATPYEEAYNMAHSRTRTVIERCFGVLKSRFRCLDKSGGTLLYTPKKSCQIIIACCVLHNYCLSRNILSTIDPHIFIEQQHEDTSPTTDELMTIGQSALNIRRILVQRISS